MEALDILTAKRRKLERAEAKLAARCRVLDSVIGGYMRAWRMAQGIGLRALARKMGITAPFLQDMERGNRRYGQKHIAAASAILSLTSQNKHP